MPLDLINETLRTILLLFPEDDPPSRALITKKVQSQAIDDELLSASEILQEHFQNLYDPGSPEDVRSLYNAYPYWGRRLHRILKEVEDPSPTSWTERFSERKKHPRHIYWAGVIALGAALFFGITATILSALQLWISYCSWQSKSEGKMCRTSGLGGEN